MTRVLEPIDISELMTEHKLITSETRNSEIKPTISKVKTKLTSSGVSSDPQVASTEIKKLKVGGIPMSV